MEQILWCMTQLWWLIPINMRRYILPLQTRPTRVAKLKINEATTCMACTNKIIIN
jgi:hypothetical protein